MRKINFKKILMTLMSMLILTSNINISVFGMPSWEEDPHKQCMSMFLEIRYDQGYIILLNGWSNYLFGYNVIASVCPHSNAVNNKKELEDVVMEALQFTHVLLPRALEPSDVNWYFFRMMAPYMKKVFDKIYYTGSCAKVMDLIFSACISILPHKKQESEKFIQTTENHFRDLHEILDGLDFHELLKLKEYMGRLERQIDDHLCSYSV